MLPLQSPPVITQQGIHGYYIEFNVLQKAWNSMYCLAMCQVYTSTKGVSTITCKPERINLREGWSRKAPLLMSRGCVSLSARSLKGVHPETRESNSYILGGWALEVQNSVLLDNLPTGESSNFLLRKLHKKTPQLVPGNIHIIELYLAQFVTYQSEGLMTTIGHSNTCRIINDKCTCSLVWAFCT